MIIDFLDGNRHGLQATLMDMGSRRAIDQQAEQFRAAVVAARIHHSLAPVDQGEIEIGNHHAFTGTQGLAQQFAFRRDDRGKAAAGDRADRRNRCPS